MQFTLFFPLPGESAAIEERYAYRQCQLLLSADGPATVLYSTEQSRASMLAAATTTDFVLVVTDGLSVPAPGIIGKLAAALEAHPHAVAAVPVTNESENPRQVRTPPSPYLTLRQFENVGASIGQETAMHVGLEWDRADPLLFLARTMHLRAQDLPLDEVLQGSPVVLVSNAYAHRYSSLRGQIRADLLERVSSRAGSILEFGCGEAALGAALKERQPCRVVGVELDKEAAAVARTRIDVVHSGDVRDLVETIDETFDWIIGGDILEHLDDPWTFLTRLRRLSAPDGRLLLSLPNIASWPIVADLLQGRFDYLYMGITCAGHLRFFTRRSIREMLEMTGWEAVSVEPQESFRTAEFSELEEKLKHSGIDYSEADLLTPGYYVLARNPS
ncbi:MAG: class I SAM-dependent methyltransferase [Acidobacteriota bacterium]